MPDWEELERNYDFVVVDTGAGISERNQSFVKAAERVILILSPEPAALSDAYGTVKSCLKRGKRLDLFCLVNQVHSERQGPAIFGILEKLVQRFLSQEIRFLGSLPFSLDVIRAMRAQEGIGEALADSPFELALRAAIAEGPLAPALLDTTPATGGTYFMRRLDYWMNHPKRGRDGAT